MKTHYMKSIVVLFASLASILFFIACENSGNPEPDTTTYKGTASVSQGPANTTVSNLYPKGQRVAGIGTIASSDGKTWTVPADVHFNDASFPSAPDLNNPDGAIFKTTEEALASLSSTQVIEVDETGEIITAYIFADNYFEMYINGIPVAKDAIPFTPFNSHLVQFKVQRPFTIAMLLVDWEENLGLGSEDNHGSSYSPGDGGMVAVFTEVNNNIIAVTNADWKAQVYYTAPIQDLACPSENGNSRISSSCSTQGSNAGSSFFALHWEKPNNWMDESFNDSEWPNASTYTNQEIGVDNKEAYTNFTSIFDKSGNDAQFIWSNNVVLDNEVLVRYTVN